MLTKANKVILLTGTRRQHETYPVAESEAVMVGSTTQVDNETEDDEANNGDDLDGSEPKFAFTERAGAQEVDDDDNDAGDSNPSGIQLGIVVPVCNCS